MAQFIEKKKPKKKRANSQTRLLSIQTRQVYFSFNQVFYRSPFTKNSTPWYCRRTEPTSYHSIWTKCNLDQLFTVECLLLSYSRHQILLSCSTPTQKSNPNALCRMYPPHRQTPHTRTLHQTKKTGRKGFRTPRKPIKLR